MPTGGVLGTPTRVVSLAGKCVQQRQRAAHKRAHLQRECDHAEGEAPCTAPPVQLFAIGCQVDDTTMGTWYLEVWQYQVEHPTTMGRLRILQYCGLALRTRVPVYCGLAVVFTIPYMVHVYTCTWYGQY